MLIASCVTTTFQAMHGNFWRSWSCQTQAMSPFLGVGFLLSGVRVADSSGLFDAFGYNLILPICLTNQKSKPSLGGK